MKKALLLPQLLAAALSAGVLACNPALAQTTQSTAEPASAAFKNPKDAISYAIGVTTARNLTKDGVVVDPALAAKGMQDVQAGTQLQMTEAEIRTVMAALVADMRQKMAANRKEAEETNRKKGDDYRAAFARQADAKSLPNGVLYKATKTGTGPKPGDDDSIVVNYRGTLTSGQQFDASPEGKPATLKLAQLIAGWKDTLKLMPSGSHWTMVIPPQLAYQQRGAGTDIGPNETLVLDVELLAVERGTAASGSLK